MNKIEKKQMKSIIKPLIKECLSEIMIEEGLIQMLKEHTIVEARQHKSNPENKPVIKKLQEESIQKKQQAITEVKKRVSSGGFDPFAGTEDLETKELKAKENEGVNISKLLGEDMIKSWNNNLV